MHFVVRKLVLAYLLALPFAAAAQQYPAKPVRVIVPFPPGNTADILGRLIAEKFSQRYGQQMIVENRPGAAGQLGLELAAQVAPDGYTIAIGQGSVIALSLPEVPTLASVAAFEQRIVDMFRDEWSLAGQGRPLEHVPRTEVVDATQGRLDGAPAPAAPVRVSTPKELSMGTELSGVLRRKEGPR